MEGAPAANDETPPVFDEDEYEARIARARRWLLIVVAMYLLGGLLLYAMDTYRPGRLGDLAENVGLAVLYVGLWVWAKRNVFAASITALLLFIAVIVANAIVSPMSLVEGIVVKILFIIVLLNAIGAAYEVRKLHARMPRARLL